MTWYCFQTAPKREVRTTHDLRQHGLQVVLLMRPELKRAHRAHKVASVPVRKPIPLLPGYIFINMARRDAWACLHTSQAKVRPVGINGQPPRPLNRAGERFIIDPPRGSYQDDACPDFESAPEFNKGDRVAVFHAGFDGVMGEVVNVTGQTARVLLQFFGAEREVSVPVSSATRAA